MSWLLRFTFAIAILALASAWTGLSQSGSVLGTTIEDPAVPYVPGEIIVRLAPGASFDRLGVDRSLLRQEHLSGQHVTIAVPEGRETDMIARLQGNPNVIYAELNTLSYPAFVPNDSQYHLQWGLPMIGLEQAWESTRGDGVAIAVIDTGVAYETRDEFAKAPQLTRTRFGFPYDAISGSTHPNDTNGHGTHVAGTLAQNTNDGVGPAGVAPDALIIPVKVCLPTGCPADAMADGVRWAVDHGANVINVSLGGQAITRAEREAYQYAESRGVVVVAAAGNGGSDSVGDNRIDYPAAYPTVISVGSVLMDGNRAPYSNYSNRDGNGLHLVAPGGSVLTDIDQNGNPDGILQETFSHACGSPTIDYRAFTSCYYQGTSMATPHVAGAAALVMSLFPSLNASEVRTVLRCSAQDLGSPGADVEFGAGLVRADLAIRDTDTDGRPDCLEEPTSFTLTSDDFDLPPGAEFSAPLIADISGQGISGYSVTISYDPAVLELRECVARHSTCALAEGAVEISASFDSPIAGEFRLADLRFRTIGTGGTSSLLSIHAGASPSSSSDPAPLVSIQDGLVRVITPPATVSGDADCLGLVDAVDLTLLLSHITGAPPPICATSADVDCSGALDTRDVRLLLLYLASLPQAQADDCPPIGSF